MMFVISMALCLLTRQILQPQIIIYTNPQVISINSFEIDLGFTFDSITILAIFVINVISSLVITYSFLYLNKDEHLQQFIAHLCLFIFCMLVLVTSADLLTLYIGWETVGLCSYLLINHWYNRRQANKAANKAMLINKIGDCFLLLAIILCWSLFGTFDLYTIFILTSAVSECIFNIFAYYVNFITFICFCLFSAAAGKSAQIGLHTWLPDAMEGPTPVSALLHAATMVTAGVLLLIRSSSLLEFSLTSLKSFMLLIGAASSASSAAPALAALPSSLPSSTATASSWRTRPTSRCGATCSPCRTSRRPSS
jgi:NADH:ubiquinone oxidoreductase subunit 5 (subunit L)/multisubunit Na+/H+ antiporter MnhA subunit